MKTSVEWGPRLVAVIAGEIRRHREARNMSTKKLSEACADLGWPIKHSALVNLELGRREKISVPEMFVLAKALGVPPVELVFSVGQVEPIEVLPGYELPAWLAEDWVTGRLHQERVRERCETLILGIEDQIRRYRSNQ